MYAGTACRKLQDVEGYDAVRTPGNPQSHIPWDKGLVLVRTLEIESRRLWHGGRALSCPLGTESRSLVDWDQAPARTSEIESSSEDHAEGQNRRSVLE
jgi:hypothetical protein